jgi:hypothetical protein
VRQEPPLDDLPAVVLGELEASPTTKTPATPTSPQLIAESMPSAIVDAGKVLPESATAPKVESVPPLFSDKQPTRKIPAPAIEVLRKDVAADRSSPAIPVPPSQDSDPSDNAMDLLLNTATQSSESSSVSKATTSRGEGRPPALPPQALVGRSSVRARQITQPGPDTSTPPSLPNSKRVTETLHTKPSESVRRTTPARATPAAGSSSGWLLPLGIAAVFAASYYGMRWYLSQQAAAEMDVAAQTDANLAEDDGAVEDPQVPGETVSIRVPEPTSTPVAVAVPEVRAPAPVSPMAPEPTVEGFPAEYAPAAQWHDGGPLTPGQGMVVVLPPDGSQVSARLDQQVNATNATQFTTTEGMHAVRIQMGDHVRFQLLSVRAGQAILVRVPTSWE